MKLSTKRQFHFINSGRIKNTYKFNGDLSCKLSEIGEDLISPQMEAWVKLANDEYLPVVIEKIERLNSQYLLKFENIISDNDAKVFQNSELFLEEKNLKNDVDKDDSMEIIGFEVFNKNKHKIGFVLDVYEIPGNPLLLIEMDKKEVMLPIADEFILLFDNENREIIIQNYEELLEI